VADLVRWLVNLVSLSSSAPRPQSALQALTAMRGPMSPLPASVPISRRPRAPVLRHWLWITAPPPLFHRQMTGRATSVKPAPLRGRLAPRHICHRRSWPAALRWN